MDLPPRNRSRGQRWRSTRAGCAAGVGDVTARTRRADRREGGIGEDARRIRGHDSASIMAGGHCRRGSTGHALYLFSGPPRASFCRRETLRTGRSKSAGVRPHRRYSPPRAGVAPAPGPVLLQIAIRMPVNAARNRFPPRSQRGGRGSVRRTRRRGPKRTKSSVSVNPPAQPGMPVIPPPGPSDGGAMAGHRLSLRSNRSISLSAVLVLADRPHDHRVAVDRHQQSAAATS